MTLIDLIPIAADMSKTDRARLELAVQYMMGYCIQIDDYAGLAKYYKMMGQINPEHKLYLQLMNNSVYRKRMRL